MKSPCAKKEFPSLDQSMIVVGTDNVTVYLFFFIDKIVVSQTCHVHGVTRIQNNNKHTPDLYWNK